MSSRDDLIGRKDDVRQKIQRLQRQLEHQRTTQQPTGFWSKGRWQQQRINKLEAELEQLMAQEYNLRLAIDQSH